MIGRVWPLVPTSCPKSLLTTHHQSLPSDPSTPPIMSLLIGTGTISTVQTQNDTTIALEMFRKASSSQPWVLTAITPINRPIPEAASVVVQAGNANSTNPPSVAYLQMLRRVLMGARVAIKGSISLTLDGGTVHLGVARAVPSPPGQGIVAIGKSTKVTITKGGSLPDKSSQSPSGLNTTGRWSLDWLF